MPEELDAGHLGHAVIGDDEGDRLSRAGELFQRAQRAGAGGRPTSRYWSP